MTKSAGLCDSCAHQRIVRNTRGSRFSLCERSRTDPAYPRYPRVPVRSCAGYERPRRPNRLAAVDGSGDSGGIDGLSRWLGLRWEAYDRVRLTIRDELINPAGLLSGPVAYAMIDYCMGSTLWEQRSGDERIATIGISINYVQTAREGDALCSCRVDRRNDRIAVLSGEVRDDEERLIATAIGSFAIFPRERLGGHDRRPPSPAES